MNLSEAEKRMIYQVEGTSQGAALNEIYITWRYAPDKAMKDTAEGLLNISVNRHLAKVGADPLCGELGHLLFNQCPFLRCHRATENDGAFPVRHSVYLRFFIRVWDIPASDF